MNKRDLPNVLTIGRLVLVVLFLVVLEQYRYGPPTVNAWALPLAAVIFAVAAITDFFDGYFARRFNVISLFGRVVDPTADKILVLAGLIYLAGPRFVIGPGVDGAPPGSLVSGVYPWMVVVILTRELLVTVMRGELESGGTDFSARYVGKLKATLQMVVVPVVLLIVWLDPLDADLPALLWVRDGLVWATVVVTALSGIPYLRAFARAIRQA